MNTLYYGEIVAKISGHLHMNPNNIRRIDVAMKKQKDHQDTIYTLCADAARIFDRLEDLSSDHFIDWHKASDIYAEKILDHLLCGNKPHIINLISIAVNSIEASLQS